MFVAGLSVHNVVLEVARWTPTSCQLGARLRL